MCTATAKRLLVGMIEEILLCYRIGYKTTMITCVRPSSGLWQLVNRAAVRISI